MKKLFSITALMAGMLAAQNLTQAQKELDFRFMVGRYNTHYAPLDWKKELLGFDALDMKPWLERVAATKTDLEFYEVCSDYVASLQDTHSGFSLPSNFVARLGFGVDIYDGLPLIESIDRALLPLRDFPFVIGDEVVSVDGVPAGELISRYSKYSPQGNPISTRRQAAARIATRAQSRMPHAAASIGDTASVVIRRQNGVVETYTINWIKTGTPLEVGPVPSPKVTSRRETAASDDYMKELNDLRHSGVSAQDVELGILNYGSRNPVFLGGLGSIFTRRLGGAASDFFYSGVFRREDFTIGFIRIPSYSPPSQTVALQQFEQEIAFFEANTDGLVIDGMRNPGGNLCFGEQIMARLTRERFETTGFELRAYWGRVLGFYNSMISAKNAAAPPEVIEQYEKLYQAMLEANRQNRGVTEPIPLCTSSLVRDPAVNVRSEKIGYTKPILMLIDEFSTSTGDSVPSMFQENKRGVVYGMRSNGAGGNNISVDAGPYSEATIGMTIGVQARRNPVLVQGYPYTRRLENVGVHPEVVNNYMTRENLLQNGAPFVKQFLDGIAAYIRQLRP
jgi:hypothetical protein